MSRITKIKLGTLEMPFTNNHVSGFMISQVTGLSDVVFSHTQVSYEDIYTTGNGRDITLLLVIQKPISTYHIGEPITTPIIDYYAVRRIVAQAAPLDEEVTLYIYIDDQDDPYAQTTCKVRNVSSSFSDERPIISIDLESLYTCLIASNKIDFTGMPFGTEVCLPEVTHDYTPVSVVIHLVPHLAEWYRIYVSSDWLSINTSVLRANYSIDQVPEGSTITIDSDESEGSLTTNYGVVLHRPGFDDENIETACDIGPAGFKFIPNEPMLVRTMKIPSAISGETIDMQLYPRLSGV